MQLTSSKYVPFPPCKELHLSPSTSPFLSWCHPSAVPVQQRQNDGIKPTSTFILSMQIPSPWDGFSQATVQSLTALSALTWPQPAWPQMLAKQASSTLFCIACNIPKQCLTSQLVREGTVNLKSKLMDCETISRCHPEHTLPVLHWAINRLSLLGSRQRQPGRCSKLTLLLAYWFLVFTLI